MLSSRVGERITTRTPFPSCGLRRRCRSGKPNAAVFPVPVWAVAKTSLLAKTKGIARVCTVVGCMYPKSAIALSSGFIIPSFSNDILTLLLYIGGILPYLSYVIDSFAI